RLCRGAVGGAFATNRSGKYWPLAYMFPRGLAAFLSLYWANSGGWGRLFRLHAVYLVHAWFTSVRGTSGRHCFFSGCFNSAYLQCLGLPHHAEYAFTSGGSVQWHASRESLAIVRRAMHKSFVAAGGISDV